MELKNLKKLTVKKGIAEKGWNVALPVPLIQNEKVWIHPDQTKIGKNGYLRIIQSDGFTVSIFSDDYFE